MKRTAVLACVLIACGGGGQKKPDTTTTTTASSGGGDTATTKTEAATPPAKGKTLFDRLGGLNAITAVVDEFVNRTTSDPRIKHRFFNTDAVELKKLLAEFVCMATGGPCKYSGRDMATSHAGM